jgi:hypothetical protein
MFWRIGAALVLLAPAARAGTDGIGMPGVLTDAPTVSSDSRLRVASLVPDGPAYTGVLTSLSWGVAPGTSATLGVVWRGEEMVPSLWVRKQILSQRASGIDASVSAAFRSIGREDAGSEFDVAVAAGRTFGAVEVAASATVGKGVGARTDVDFEAASSVVWRLTREVRAGFETRARGELVDDVKTAEDDGRPLDIIAGPSVSLTRGAVTLDVLGGWQSPRGSAAPRAIALFAASCAF